MFELPWWGLLLVAFGLTHAVIVLVTVYFHRAMAHRAVTLAPALNRVCRFLAWFLISMDPREFAAVHRKHHAHCDTVQDPHSPLRFGLARVLFGGLGLYRNESKNPDTLASYGHGLPEDSWEPFYARHPLLGIALLAGLLTFLLGGGGLLVWAVLMAWIPFWAAGVVNGLGHAVGYRRFPTDDRSTNLVPWGVWLGGEELHNNHHADPSSPRFSTAWYEFDLGWAYIRLACALGWARLRAEPGRAQWEEAHGEPVSLSAQTVGHVLRARYAWLAHFHHSLSHDAREALRAHGFRRWRDLSALWDCERRALPTGARRRLAAVQAHPVLVRFRLLETELRELWGSRFGSSSETVEAWNQWLHRAREAAQPALTQFCDRLSRATWSGRLSGASA